MSNLFSKIVKNSLNPHKMEEQLKILQENTKKFENKLSLSFETYENYIKNWEMPKQNIKELYKIGNWGFKRDYIIEISKNTHTIGSNTETIELLEIEDLQLIKKEKYKILHIGAIQVAAKPLTRLDP